MTPSKFIAPIAILLAGTLIVAPVHAASDSGCMCKTKGFEKKIQVIFEQIDRDGNGQISQDEFKGFVQFMKALHSMRSMMHGSKKEKEKKGMKSMMEDKES